MAYTKGQFQFFISKYRSMEQWLIVNTVWVAIANFAVKLAFNSFNGATLKFFIVVILALVTATFNFILALQTSGKFWSRTIFFVSGILTLLGAVLVQVHGVLDTVIQLKTVLNQIFFILHITDHYIL